MPSQTPHLPRVSNGDRSRRTPPTATIRDPWPALPLERWRDTYQTLHLYTQMVGKVRLALTPKENQWWNVPLYVTTRGLTTTPIPNGDKTFEVEFDFVEHELVLRDSDDRIRRMPLAMRSVADFYARFFTLLHELDVEVQIWPRPVEIVETTPFPEDAKHGVYVRDHAAAFFQVIRRIAPAFERFRARFRGKCSPVHFFWGSFDLAVTRFSGRRAPLRSGPIFERDAYDEECISLGFWPGDVWGAVNGASPIDACFYSYTVPEPQDLSKQRVSPAGASYSTGLKEFMLPYELVRTSTDPSGMILDFAESTYQAGARLAGWNRQELAYP